MSLLSLCEWLAETKGSIALHESLYGYPLTESVHVWSLAVFVGFSALWDLRLIGLAFPNIPVSTFNKRLMPWMIGGFVVMVISGFMLFYAIPVRSYQSVWFRVKVIFLLFAGLNVFVFGRGALKRLPEWDTMVKPPRGARVAGIASLALWTCIIFAGRMIAYNWFDCDRQPQSRFVNWFAACTAEQQEVKPIQIVDPPSYAPEPPATPSGEDSSSSQPGALEGDAGKESGEPGQ
jgi:Family of unknown function (DUF6644)